MRWRTTLLLRFVSINFFFLFSDIYDVAFTQLHETVTISHTKKTCLLLISSLIT